MSDQRYRTDSERLAVIETTVTTINLRLFGQDGDAGLVDRFEKRLSKLENWRWQVVGIAIGLGAVTGGVVSHLLEAITK